MENFFVFLIFLIMVVGPILRFYNRWKESRASSFKNNLPHQGYVEGEFYPADRPPSTHQNSAGQGNEPQPPGQIITFEDYVFFLDGSNQQVGDTITTSLSGAQSTGEQYAEKYKKAIDIYKFVAGKRIWIDKIYPPSDSKKQDGGGLLGA
jgi:hypothetical protein